MTSAPGIAVTYGDSGVGARLVAELSARGTVTGIASEELLQGDLKLALEGAETVVHVASATMAPLDGTRRLLEAAGDAACSHLVVVTSALVYGAWPTNPIPLTEDAPLRPNPGFEPAVLLAEVERLVAEWHDAHPGAAVTVLRPAPVVGEGEAGWLAPMLAAVRGVPIGDADPPGQYLHVDDLASAVAVAMADRTAGSSSHRVFNVAPEGWVAADALRALQGGPRVRLPGRVAERVASWRFRAGMSPRPPGLLAWMTAPWVVAADRLRALGWSATHTNEEAFVAGHRPSPWATVSPRRRQELALAVAAGVTTLAAVAAAVAVSRRLSRAARPG
jgi:nucleoside-diphosphate-sugar epimerase